MNSSLWAEWDTTNTLIALTSGVAPRIDYRMNADISLALFNEIVMTTPKTEWGETDLLSNRAGLLFSWNFRPKSWVYLAVNDYRTRDVNGRLQLQNRIGALKAKYLVYF